MNCPNEFAAGLVTGIIVVLALAGLIFMWLYLGDRP